jgi:hypothetical protein
LTVTRDDELREEVEEGEVVGSMEEEEAEGGVVFDLE